MGGRGWRAAAWRLHAALPGLHVLRRRLTPRARTKAADLLLPLPLPPLGLPRRWDPLTREIFQFVRSKGVATYSQLDAHIKAHCAKLIAGARAGGAAHAGRARRVCSLQLVLQRSLPPCLADR